MNIFLIFAQNINCGYTHNLCFRAKTRKNVYPCTLQFYYTKLRYKGIFVTRACFRDACHLDEVTFILRAIRNTFSFLFDFSMDRIAPNGSDAVFCGVTSEAILFAYMYVP